MLNYQINIITALLCEARPLIERYQLEQVSVKPFAMYQSAEHSINLIISGIGSVASGAATAYLQAITSNLGHAAFLNVGIAGSMRHNLGAVLSIDKLVDSITQQHYYPFILKNMPLESTTLTTYPQPQTQYPACGLVDMEGVGFFVTAKRFTPRELVQFVKVVSDTPAMPTQTVSAKQVAALIQQALTNIDYIIDQLKQLAATEATLQPASMIDAVTQHITTYQRHQLNELLRRWQVIYPNRPPPLDPSHSAQAILEQLTHDLDQADY